MVYRATEGVVQRVMPLLDVFAERTIDKARLLQYLSARAGIAWGALELLSEETQIDAEGNRVAILRVADPAAGTERLVQIPDCLPVALDCLVQAEYRRLATAEPLSLMAVELFDALYHESHCARCRWNDSDHSQIRRECRFAGRPVNFEPVTEM